MRLVWWITMILGVFFVGVTLAMFVAYQAWWHATHERYTVEKTDYTTPKSKNEIELVDDVIGDKNPTFDPDLIDSRPIEDWQVNKSAAVIGLDCPVLKPDRDAAYFQLHSSYLEAAKYAEDQGWQLLPSANMIDGAGKQFDDGMFAAIELACFTDQAGDLAGAVALVRSMAELAESGEASRPYLLAALELSGEKVPTDDPDAAAVAVWLQQFKIAPLSRPAGFYNWNTELQATWRTFKFLQTKFDSDKEDVARSLAGLLEQSETLRADYIQLYQFYERLSNPSQAMSLDPLVGRSGDSMTQIMESLPAQLDAPSFLPQSSSRETELFQALFPVALPADANLMVELIKKIKSGEVDLAPTSDEGWYHSRNGSFFLKAEGPLLKISTCIIKNNPFREKTKMFLSNVTVHLVS